jgi:hypothetical protein
MKKHLQYFLMLLLVVAVSCSSETEEEKAKKVLMAAISEFASPDVIDSIQVVDTISMESIQAASKLADSAMDAFDTLLASIPLQIESAKRRIAVSEEELAKLKFEMLRPMWLQTLEQDQATLEQLNQMLQSSEEKQARAQVKQNFINKAIENGLEGTAYYKIKGYSSGDYREYFVSPGAVVLNEKSE